MEEEKKKEIQWFENLPPGEKEPSDESMKAFRAAQNSGKTRTAVNLEKHTADAYGWLNRIAGKLGARNRLDWAYHALRGVLHALRDRMTPEEVFQLSAQLPLLIRGIFFEGYQITGKPEKMTKLELLNRIEKEMGEGHVIKAKTAFMAVLKVLYDHVTEGELDDIYATMPTDIKEFWDRSLKTSESFI